MKGSRLALIAGALAAAFLLSSSEALADKLILFKNGKVMRVKSAQSGKNWTTLNLGKDNVIGVPNTQIVGIEEASATSVNRASSSTLPNQASVTGRGGGRSRGGGRGGNRPPAFNRSGQPVGTPRENEEDGEELDELSGESPDGASAGRDKGPRRRGSPGVSGVRSLQENLRQINSQAGSRSFRSSGRGSSFNTRARGSQGGRPVESDR